MAARPQPVEHSLHLSRACAPVLGCGAWFRNTLCLIAGDQARLTHSVGDLAHPEACLAHERLAEDLWVCAPAAPRLIAHDLHPDFHSTRHAQWLAQQLGVPALGVQHHHAHIAAVCAEQGLDGPVLGLALDGVGLGSDGTAWGGELLWVDGAQLRRLDHLRPLAMPGGDAAAQQPWRMAAAALHRLGRSDAIPARFAEEAAAPMLLQLLQREVRCPPTTSLGRAFDAAAGLLGLCHTMTFEAEAAIALEQAATRHIAREGWPAPLQCAQSTAGIDLDPVFAALADGMEAEHGAALFHATVVEQLAHSVARAAEASGVRTVVGAGGCFLNALLRTGLNERCAAMKVRMRCAEKLSHGDAAIAVGQAWIAAHALEP